MAAFPATSCGYASYALWEQPCCPWRNVPLSISAQLPVWTNPTLDTLPYIMSIVTFTRKKIIHICFKISILTLHLPPPSLHHHNLFYNSPGTVFVWPWPWAYFLCSFHLLHLQGASLFRIFLPKVKAEGWDLQCDELELRDSRISLTKRGNIWYVCHHKFWFLQYN